MSCPLANFGHFLEKNGSMNLTKLECAAHDYVRVKAQSEGKVAPCWLVMSDEAKLEAKQGLLKMLNDQRILSCTLTEDNFQFHCGHAVSNHLYQKWLQTEKEYQALREKGGDPLAFFAN